MNKKTLLRSVGIFCAGALAATLTPAISAVDVSSPPMTTVARGC